MTACERCKGACCESIVLPIKHRDEDTQRWLSYHGKVVEDGIRFDCKCSKLKNGKCSIYNDRPEVCRTYEVGSESCRKAVADRRHHIANEIYELMV